MYLMLSLKKRYVKLYIKYDNYLKIKMRRKDWKKMGQNTNGGRLQRLVCPLMVFCMF